jgi:hypothetical protein
MFFRRETPREPSFAERIESLKNFGFAINLVSSGSAQVSRDGIGAIIEDRPGQRPHVNKAGLIVCDEIGALVNAGYQMFWRTPSGKRVPALATQLKLLHNFEEDLKEALGLPSLYNQSLGTTSDLHLYDRVEHRDEPPAPKPWDHPFLPSRDRKEA